MVGRRLSSRCKNLVKFISCNLEIIDQKYAFQMVKIIYLIGAGFVILFLISEIILFVWLYKDNKDVSLIHELIFSGNTRRIDQLTPIQKELFRVHSFSKKIVIGVGIFCILGLFISILSSP